MLLQGPVSPMLATSGRAIPDGAGWILEPKFDGWRLIAHVTPTAPASGHGTAAAITTGFPI